MIERHFSDWDNTAVQELEKMCRNMPVLPSQRAKAFFKHANRAAKSDAKVLDRSSGNLFDGITGFAGASDRKDFSVRYDDGNTEHFSHGIMILETYDKSIKVTFCLARVSFRDFLTCGWLGDDKRQALKTVLSKQYSSAIKKWWQLWKVR
jgi:hypothetical protein